MKLDDNSWVVHAGVKPGIPMEKQSKDDLVYLRYTDNEGKFLSLRKIYKENYVGARFWT